MTTCKHGPTPLRVPERPGRLPGLQLRVPELHLCYLHHKSPLRLQPLPLLSSLGPALKTTPQHPSPPRPGPHTRGVNWESELLKGEWWLICKRFPDGWMEQRVLSGEVAGTARWGRWMGSISAKIRSSWREAHGMGRDCLGPVLHHSLPRSQNFRAGRS